MVDTTGILLVLFCMSHAQFPKLNTVSQSYILLCRVVECLLGKPLGGGVALFLELPLVPWSRDAETFSSNVPTSVQIYVLLLDEQQKVGAMQRRQQGSNLTQKMTLRAAGHRCEKCRTLQSCRRRGQKASIAPRSAEAEQQSICQIL